MTVTPAPTKGKGMNGSTKYITIIGILMTVILALGARQVEWGSIGTTVESHIKQPAHAESTVRIRALEDTELVAKQWRKDVDAKLAAIMKATGARVEP